MELTFTHQCTAYMLHVMNLSSNENILISKTFMTPAFTEFILRLGQINNNPFELTDIKSQ